MNVKHATTPQEIEDAKLVRKLVFQIEQCIDEAADFDGKDDVAIHFVAYDEEPIGEARVRFPDDANRAKIERVSVIPKHRGKGVGKDIMIKIDEHLREHGVAEIYLDAQSHVKNFYEKLGYTQVGEEFEEVGIPHVVMVKRLT
jgi:predicted GNAT family N-acyltransferase